MENAERFGVKYHYTPCLSTMKPAIGFHLTQWFLCLYGKTNFWDITEKWIFSDIKLIDMELIYHHPFTIFASSRTSKAAANKPFVDRRVFCERNLFTCSRFFWFCFQTFFFRKLFLEKNIFLNWVSTIILSGYPVLDNFVSKKLAFEKSKIFLLHFFLRQTKELFPF